MVALVSSPLQFENLRAFMDREKIDKHQVFIVFFHQYILDRLVLDGYNYTMIQLWPLRQPGKALWFYTKMVSLALRLKRKHNTVIAGDIESRFMQLFCKLMKPEKLDLIDDGIKSVHVFNKLNKILEMGLIKFNIQIHTQYPIWKTYSDNIQSKHIEPGSKPTPKPLSDEVWFIGQPLLEDRRMDEETLAGHIKKVDELTEGRQEIKYFLHHRENRTHELFNNISLVQNEVPFEDYLLSVERHPRMIIGFYSTALAHVRLSLPDDIDIKAVRVKVDERVEDIYKYFDSIGIGII